MDEINLTPAAEEDEPQEAVFATVAAIYSDGVSLLFDGAEEPSQKHYLCNTTAFFERGDRVKLCRDSGTIVVEYPVGPPSPKTHGIPAGGTAGQVLTKTSAANYAAGWVTPTSPETHGIPAGGTAGQVLAKTSAANYAAGWQDLTSDLPAGGAQGAALVKKTSADRNVEWARIAGTQNQYQPSSTLYGGPSYDIQFRTTTVGANPVFQIRMGPSGTWKTITVT